MNERLDGYTVGELKAQLASMPDSMRIVVTVYVSEHEFKRLMGWPAGILHIYPPKPTTRAISSHTFAVTEANREAVCVISA